MTEYITRDEWQRKIAKVLQAYDEGTATMRRKMAEQVTDECREAVLDALDAGTKRERERLVALLAQTDEGHA